MNLTFESGALTPGRIGECYKAQMGGPPNAPTCSALDDPMAFTIPASGEWKTEYPAPSLSAVGFADDKGKAVLRVQAGRIENVHSGQATQHTVTAKDDAEVVIKMVNRPK